MLSLFLHSAARRPWLSLGLVAVILLSMALSVLPPLVLSRVIDDMTAGADMEGSLLVPGISYFLLTVLANGTESLKAALITIFGESTTHRIRSAMAEKLSRLPAPYFDAHESGRMASLFVNDVDTIETLFQSGVIGMISDALQIISLLFVIYFLSPGLFGLLLIALPLLFLLTRAFQKRMRSAQLAYRAALASASGLIPETIRNRRAIFFLSAEPFMKSRYGKAIADSFAAMSRSNFYDSIYSPIIITISACLIALLVVLSAADASLFGLSAGTAAALIAYLHRIFSPLESIGMEIQNIQSAMAGITRISDFLREKEMASPEEISISPDNAISLRHISFAYDKSQPIFTDLSLTFPKGSTTTLMGRTGAGKSTIFKLLLGLATPTTGEISIFGRNPASISESEKRKLFGVVPQAFRPVLGNLRDQLTLGDPRVTEEEIKRALTTVGLYDLCMHFPEKLDTPYSDALFSQGQKQLLSIARAIALDPEVLLLDEITANLDAGTEQEVLTALQSAAKNRTVIGISHRGEQGRVVEVGV